MAFNNPNILTRPIVPAFKTIGPSFQVVGLAVCLHKTAFTFQRLYSRLYFFGVAQTVLPNRPKKMDWSVRSNASGSGFDPSSTNSSNGGTRLLRAIMALRIKLSSRIQEIKKNLPSKLLSFLVGFYCATAFATVIGQTGDWDILSAALAVAVVEGIGALTYKSSLPLFNKLRGLIGIFNYWKAGLALGLFLDSFKY